MGCLLTPWQKISCYYSFLDPSKHQLIHMFSSVVPCSTSPGAFSYRPCSPFPHHTHKQLSPFSVSPRHPAASSDRINSRIQCHGVCVHLPIYCLKIDTDLRVCIGQHLCRPSIWIANVCYTQRAKSLLA